MSKYKLLIQYDEDMYEKLIVFVNRFTSDIETEYLGDMMITLDDIRDLEKGEDLTPTIERELYAYLSYNTREYISAYTINMYNTLDNLYLYGNKTFTGIEIIEIDEEDNNDK